MLAGMLLVTVLVKPINIYVYIYIIYNIPYHIIYIHIPFILPTVLFQQLNGWRNLQLILVVVINVGI